jgi:hypothetical protein
VAPDPYALLVVCLLTHHTLMSTVQRRLTYRHHQKQQAARLSTVCRFYFEIKGRAMTKDKGQGIRRQYNIYTIHKVKRYHCMPWRRLGREDGQRLFPVASVSRPSLGPTQPPVQCVPGVLSPGVKRGRGVMLTTHPHLVPRS